MIPLKISVIIPTYKPQYYLWECLDSLNAQTMPLNEFDVILVLNGCKDPYKKQIEGYLKESSLNIDFVETDVPGVSNARNIALDVARGEYICFIDDDDYVSPTYLEELYDKAAPDVVSLCRPVAFLEGKDGFMTYRIEEEFKKCCKNGIQPFQKAKKFFSGPCMKLIHRDVIGDRRFDIRFKNGEDSLFMFLISDKLKWTDFTSENAIYYRRYRKNSALTVKRSNNTVIINSFNTIKTYNSIYFPNMLEYNIGFFCTRILGHLHSLLRTLFKSYL